MKRNGFSMIELVFVIVILGVLAAVAVPRFVTTRTDAQVAMLRSDIASTLKAIPARIFAENLDPTAATPAGFNSWSEWIIDTGGLDRGRWISVNLPVGRGVAPIAKDGVYCGATQESDAVIAISTSGNLVFEPKNVAKTNSAQTLCKSLMNSYPSGSNRVIPLATTGAVKF
ncbi:hypothetical protein CCY99_00115 [Helicobacter sp. 16-1353]|uniref:type II secretion system protein n=1 Tax=Helicobacter sp. 16-1353 TaxID=2004996 RepID=UPI000DCBD443|nr:prepilin-type N-terminal cleavage/methylation domain-containing protein [Helicobacter sp. 16-1353]RAX55139.1 hypothetical protein CCY99_00115 [Helicobacter sp. 16-1353]